MENPSTYRLFDQQRLPASLRVRSRQASLEHKKATPMLRCIGCRVIITSPDEAIEIAGNHYHTCTNPHGFSYTIACFAQAPGVRTETAPVHEHSWFPGYTWQITVCQACRLHLGWRFSGASEFFGLILNRLVALPANDDDY